MEEKPKSIRRRPGFFQAVVDAADRIRHSDASDRHKLIATQAKLDVLHEAACRGSEEADRQLSDFIGELAEDQHPSIVRQVAFFKLERRALAADELSLEKVPELLQELETFFSQLERATSRHLRLASATVHAINRLEDGDQREDLFVKFGTMFAKSESRDLANYGRKLARSEQSTSQLVGKTLELAGNTALGPPLDWNSYRGKIVLVDFWATWCGPCLREMPRLKAIYSQHHPQGFDIVGISLDRDLEAVDKFLQEQEIPWTNVLGEETQQLARTCGVRGIPTMILVDRQGKVVAVEHQVDKLQARIGELLEKQD